MRKALACAVFVVPLVIAAVACTTDYQKGLDDPSYGAPNALAGQKQPASSTDLAAVGEGGAGTAGGGGSSTIVCVATGGTLVDGGPCAVKFSTDVLPILGNATCTQTSCHGGATPPTPPRIEPSDAPGMWAEFAGFKMNTGGLPYINPCSTDKTKSGIACNLYATGACGVKMPLGGTPQVAQADIDKIEAWLACGSPNN